MDDSGDQILIIKRIVGIADDFHPDQESSVAQYVVFDWVVRRGQVLSREGEVLQ